MTWLKVLLVSLLSYGESIAKKNHSLEYDLINAIICGFTFETVNENLMSWKKNSSYASYDRLNPKNLKSKLPISFDLDEIFTPDQRKHLDEKLGSIQPTRINSDSLSCKIDLMNISGFFAKKVIFSYSYPIISEGINGETYGLILESEVFEINYTLRLKLFIKQKDSWKLIHAEDLAFS